MSQHSAKFSHQPRKRFGQNFLTDDGVIDGIVSAIAPTSSDKLIEIGPGKGALTEPLLQQCPALTVIELDRNLVTYLHALQKRYPLLQIVQNDVLDVDFTQFASTRTLRVVGNLPYNISTPLLFHLLKFDSLLIDMHFMLQNEVVDRMTAVPNSKAYGRLSVMVQYYAQVEKLFTVDASSFSPSPKVTSAIVRVTPRANPPCIARNEPLFAKIVMACFQMRRKTLRNSLRQFAGDAMMADLDIDLSLRPEALSVEDFVYLSNCFHSLN